MKREWWLICTGHNLLKLFTLVRKSPHLRVTLAEATDRRGSTVNAIMYIAPVLDNALHLHIRDRALQEALPR